MAHPNTLNAMDQLIPTYELQGCTDEAEELRAQVVEIKKEGGAGAFGQIRPIYFKILARLEKPKGPKLQRPQTMTKQRP